MSFSNQPSKFQSTKNAQQGNTTRVYLHTRVPSLSESVAGKGPSASPQPQATHAPPSKKEAATVKVPVDSFSAQPQKLYATTAKVSSKHPTICDAVLWQKSWGVKSHISPTPPIVHKQKLTS
jgi:hypothetical protein